MKFQVSNSGARLNRETVRVHCGDVVPGMVSGYFSMLIPSEHHEWAQGVLIERPYLFFDDGKVCGKVLVSDVSDIAGEHFKMDGVFSGRIQQSDREFKNDVILTQVKEKEEAPND